MSKSKYNFYKKKKQNILACFKMKIYLSIHNYKYVIKLQLK